MVRLRAWRCTSAATWRVTDADQQGANVILVMWEREGEGAMLEDTLGNSWYCFSLCASSIFVRVESMFKVVFKSGAYGKAARALLMPLVLISVANRSRLIFCCCWFAWYVILVQEWNKENIRFYQALYNRVHGQSYIIVVIQTCSSRTDIQKNTQIMTNEIWRENSALSRRVCGQYRYISKKTTNEVNFFVGWCGVALC